MKVLFGQGRPVPLRHYLLEHVVAIFREKGWSEKSNGEFVDLEEFEDCEILETTEQNLRHQQNISERDLASIVLLGTKWVEIMPKDNEIRFAIDKASYGDIVEICLRGS